MLTNFFRRKEPFDRERLTVRILADARDVDPDENSEQDRIGSPTVDLPPDAVVAEWFLPRITLQLCLDTGNGVLQWLTKDNVAKWGASSSQLFSAAIDNLNAKVPAAQLNVLRSDGGEVYSPLCEGVTPSSLILADRLLSDFGFARENIAATIPNRDSFYFCDRTSSGSLDLLRIVTDFAWDDEDCPRKYRITKNVLVSDERAAFGWAPLQQLN